VPLILSSIFLNRGVGIDTVVNFFCLSFMEVSFPLIIFNYTKLYIITIAFKCFGYLHNNKKPITLRAR